jgi:hypothetical protein
MAAATPAYDMQPFRHKQVHFNQNYRGWRFYVAESEIEVIPALIRPRGRKKERNGDLLRFSEQLRNEKRSFITISSVN